MPLYAFGWVGSWSWADIFKKLVLLLLFDREGWRLVHHNLFLGVTKLIVGYYLRKSLGASLSVLILILEPIVKPNLFLVFSENSSYILYWLAI